MATDDVEGTGTPADPWQLTTPPGKSTFEAYRDPDADPPALVVQVGKTQLRYHLSCIEDLHAMLSERGDWMPLGNADEQKPAADGTVEAWGRSTTNPVGGWYGFKKGLRGRFGNYVPPVLEALGLAEVEHNARNNRMRARSDAVRSRAMMGLRYAPYDEMAGAPNVVVDGSSTEGTVLCLSHWPNTPAPPGLEADLSAQMALAYLDRFDLHGSAELVSNNHFDQDGLISVYTLVEPDAARAQHDFLVDIAGAGDFATYTARDAARISMVIAAYADPDRSPLAIGAGDDRVRVLYQEMLGRLPELIARPDRARDLWEDEDATLTASELLVRSGAVRIEEDAELDLAVVFVPPGAPDAGGHRFGGGRWVKGLHPMAINNATARLGILTMEASRYEFSYRYESWVQYRSSVPRPRVDLSPFAEELSADEPGDARWIFEGVSELSPRLYLDGATESVLAPNDFRARLTAHLLSAAPAWDPYSPRRS